MSLPKLIELIFGTATLLGQVIVVAILVVREFSLKDWFPFILGTLFFLLLPALIVFVGAYAHVVDRKGYGRIVLFIGALVMSVFGLIGLFGGVLYVYGLGLGSVMLFPSLTAPVAFISSLFTNLDRSADSQRRFQ